MEPDDLSRMGPEALSRLLGLDRSEEPDWQMTDLHAIMSHQLDAEIQFDLTCFGGVDKGTVASLTARGGGEQPATFRSVLSDPDSPLEMLEQIRRFAKRCRTQRADGMPEQVATALYYAAIAAARLRHRASISKLDDESLLEGLAWGLQQPWMAPPLQALFTEAVEVIRSEEREDHA